MWLRLSRCLGGGDARSDYDGDSPLGDDRGVSGPRPLAPRAVIDADVLASGQGCGQRDDASCHTGAARRDDGTIARGIVD